MQIEEFEDSILDYLDGLLDPTKKIEFEKALANNPELAALLKEYKSTMRVEAAIHSETYTGSPKFALNVMQQISKERVSLFSYLSNFVRVHPGALAAMTLLMLLTLTIYQPNSSNSPISPISQTQGSNTNIDPAGAAAITPIEIGVFDSALPQSAFDDDQTRSKQAASLNELLNSLNIPFPIGSARPVGISYEAVVSPRNKNELILRITLTAEQQAAVAIKDVMLALRFNPKVASKVQPVIGGEISSAVSLDESVWAHGVQMQQHQQFTSLIFVQLATNAPQNTAILAGKVTYALQQGKKGEELFSIDSNNILSSINQASKGMREAYIHLFPNYKFTPQGDNTLQQFRNKLDSLN